MVKGAQAKHKSHKRAANMVIMAEHQAFARSFDALFSAGMALIDKVSRYFNSISGKEAEYCSPALAPFYERERKRLGAVVMQMAAWLWLERALRDDDMSAERVAAEKKKLVFAAKSSANANGGENSGGKPALTEYDAYFAQLPQSYRLLAEEVEHFVGRIRYMDKETGSFSSSLRHKTPNPVTQQLQKLHRVFGRKK